MVAPGWPFGRPGVRPVFFRSDFGAGLPSPSDDGGLRGVLRVLLYLGGQLGDLRLQFRYQLLSQVRDLRYLHPELRDLRIPLRQQLPQPRVRRAQPGDHLMRRGRITGHRGRIGHKRHTARAGPR